MMKEIGGEFWDAAPKKGETEFLLSGRTALEFIICDILKGVKYISVLMPSYLCDSMIEPFLRHGFEIRFYDVYFDVKKGLCAEMPEFRKNEIFYFMNYFGFREPKGLDRQTIRAHYPIIIEDTTHSYFNQTSAIVDYSYASLRKWAGLDGISIAAKCNGSFIAEKPVRSFNEYIELKQRAKRLKSEYMQGNIDEKQEFLSLFSRAEEMLENDYIGYRADIEGYRQLMNLDIKAMCQVRRSNAEVLMRRLKSIPGVRLMFESADKGAVPLFVPIIVEKKRNDLRRYLIENAVYCPVHWPLSDAHRISDTAKKIYGETLSLVCDQRYGADDMNRIADLIEAFFNIDL